MTPMFAGDPALERVATSTRGDRESAEMRTTGVLLRALIPLGEAGMAQLDCRYFVIVSRFIACALHSAGRSRARRRR
jgi:hypothetical protein